MEAKDVSVRLEEKVDILFLGCSYYAFDVDEAVKKFIVGNKDNIGKIVCFGTSAMMKSMKKPVSKVADTVGVAVAHEEFHCRGQFDKIRKNRLNAAEECHISQSAVSQQVRALERELGFYLLERKNRKFILTPAGEYFYKKSLVLIADYEQMCREAGKLAKDDKAALVIGGQGFMPVEGVKRAESFGSSISRILLFRNGSLITRNYCAFWKKDNSGYYVEELQIY